MATNQASQRSRRMVSLGKVTAPKPVNLPSQKKESTLTDMSGGKFGGTSVAFAVQSSWGAGKELSGDKSGGDGGNHDGQSGESTGQTGHEEQGHHQVGHQMMTRVIPAQAQPAWGGAGLPEERARALELASREQFPNLGQEVVLAKDGGDKYDDEVATQGRGGHYHGAQQSHQYWDEDDRGYGGYRGAPRGRFGDSYYYDEEGAGYRGGPPGRYGRRGGYGGQGVYDGYGGHYEERGYEQERESYRRYSDDGGYDGQENGSHPEDSVQRFGERFDAHNNQRYDDRRYDDRRYDDRRFDDRRFDDRRFDDRRYGGPTPYSPRYGGGYRHRNGDMYSPRTGYGYGRGEEYYGGGGRGGFSGRRRDDRRGAGRHGQCEGNNYGESETEEFHAQHEQPMGDGPKAPPPPPPRRPLAVPPPPPPGKVSATSEQSGAEPGAEVTVDAGMTGHTSGHVAPVQTIPPAPKANKSSVKVLKREPESISLDIDLGTQISRPASRAEGSVDSFSSMNHTSPVLPSLEGLSIGHPMTFGEDNTAAFDTSEPPGLFTSMVASNVEGQLDLDRTDVDVEHDVDIHHADVQHHADSVVQLLDGFDDEKNDGVVDTAIRATVNGESADPSHSKSTNFPNIQFGDIMLPSTIDGCVPETLSPHHRDLNAGRGRGRGRGRSERGRGRGRGGRSERGRGERGRGGGRGRGRGESFKPSSTSVVSGMTNAGGVVNSRPDPSASPETGGVSTVVDIKAKKPRKPKKKFDRGPAKIPTDGTGENGPKAFSPEKTEKSTRASSKLKIKGGRPKPGPGAGKETENLPQPQPHTSGN